MNRKYMGVISLCVLAALGLFAIPAWAMTTAGVDVHGFVSQGFLYSDEYNYLAHNSKDGSFEYNEFGINFSKDLTDKLRMGMQFFSRDIGDASNNKVTVDWAYGDYRFKDWVGLRAGRIKLPLGLYNETRDVDMLRTSIVTPQSIYSDLSRDTTIAANGAGIYGDISLGPAGMASYQFIVGAITSDNDSGIKKIADSSFGGTFTLQGNADTDTSYAGSLRWETPLPGLLLGYSVFSNSSEMTLLFGDHIPVVGGTTTVGEMEYFMQIFSVEYTWNDLLISGEYRISDNEFTIMGRKSDSTASGWYVSASYRFTDLLTLGAYYSVQYQDDDDKDGDNFDPSHRAWQKDLATTLRFDLNDYWVFKIEGHWVDGTQSLVATDNFVDGVENDYSEDTWYYGAAKVTFSF